MPVSLSDELGSTRIFSTRLRKTMNSGSHPEFIEPKVQEEAHIAATSMSLSGTPLKAAQEVGTLMVA